MGFHDVEWAYSIDRPLAETAVLAALCHRTDDATHETFVGQQAIAEMIGSSPEKVLRALKALEAAGVITRTRRSGPGGYRTSDLIRVNVDTYLTNHLPGETPSGRNAYQENRRDLHDDSSSPTRQKVTAEEINQIDQPEDQDLLSDSFDRAYAAWPKKVKRKASLQAFIRSTMKRDVEQLVADVIRHGTAYAATREKQFIPALCVWLRGERWEDEIPTSPLPNDKEWQAFISRPEQSAATVSRITGAETADCRHRWLADGTCNFCPSRREATGAGKTMLTRGGEHMAYIASLADEQEGVA